VIPFGVLSTALLLASIAHALALTMTAALAYRTIFLLILKMILLNN
jgi:hypothetical protein